MIVVPCPLTWHSAHITAPDVIRHYITGVAAMIVVPYPLTWHSAHIKASDAIRHYITGVAAPPQHVLSGTSMDMPLLRGRSRHFYNGHGTTTRRHFPFLRILPFCVLRRRFAFRRVLLYLCSGNEDKGLCGALFSCPKGTSTVWATVFSVAQTVKTVAQTVWREWATAKSEGETGKFAVDTVKLS